MEQAVVVQRTSVGFPHAACAPKLDSLAIPPEWGHQEMSPRMRVQLGCLVLVHICLQGHLGGSTTLFCVEQGNTDLQSLLIGPNAGTKSWH